MTRDKDLKRLIRARMQKTGESYTAARAQVVGRALPTLPEDYEALAGHRDEVVLARTGRGWAAWVGLLDELGATELSHRELARRVAEHLEDRWWVQAVAVGYERLRGLRAVGQQRDGSFSVSKSRTCAASAAAVFALLRDDAARARWLGEASTVRRASVDKNVALIIADGALVEVRLVARGEARCAVTATQGALGSAAEAEAARARWGARLSALELAAAAHGGAG